MPNFDFKHVFAAAIAELYQAYQTVEGIIDFLSQRLPAQYAINPSILVNTQKEVSFQFGLIYDKATTPIIFATDKLPIVAASNIYGGLFYTESLDQYHLASMLEGHQKMLDMYWHQQEGNEVITSPLSIFFIEELADYLTLNDLEDRLLAEEYPPDIVLVLNAGLLITLNKQTIEWIVLLEKGISTHSFDKTIRDNLIDITTHTLQSKYFKLASIAKEINLFYFYLILIELLKMQPLMETKLPPELVAIWSDFGHSK